MDNATAADFGGLISLRGYSLRPKQIEPGGLLRLTLFWQGILPMSTDYHAFTHLVDAHGKMWGQEDTEIGGSLNPTSRWAPGEPWFEEYDILVEASAPLAKYTIQVGVYDLDTMKRLPVIPGRPRSAFGDTGGSVQTPWDMVTIGPVTVATTP